jgi:hypothetical protein
MSSGSGVTYNETKFFGFDTGFVGHLHLLQFSIKIRNLALTPILNCNLYIAIAISQLQSTVHYNTHRVLLVCCPSLVFGYRFPTVDVPVPGFPNIPRTTATETRDSELSVTPSSEASSCHRVRPSNYHFWSAAQ